MKATSFIEQMREKAEPGFLWRDLKALAGALALIGFGVAAAVSSEGGGNQIASYLFIGGGIAWLAYLARRYAVRRQLASHPIGNALAALGDLAAVKSDVDADFASQPIDALPLQVGRRFACFARKGQVMVRPLADIVWAYHEVVRHSVNMIPTGRTHQLVLWKRNGEADVLPVAKSQMEACIQKLSAAAPWLPVGYNDMLKESWNGDRREFIAMVDATRAKATATA